MTWWASPCSSTTTARRSRRRAPAAPARTSTTPAAAAEALGIPHYVLDYESRFRDGGDGGLRRRLPARRDAGALHPLQPDGQVPRPGRSRPRAGRRRRWRPATTCSASRRPRRARAAPRGRSGARPELLPVRHHARAAGVPALPARRAGEAGSAADGGRARPRRRRQAGQPGHLLRAGGPLHHGRSTGCVRMARWPATSSTSTAACSAATRASPATPSARGAA